MRHAKAILVSLGAGLLVAGAVACSDMALTSADGSTGPGGSSSSSSSGGSKSPENAENQGPTANGVLLVHAAGFPAFRLCFENYLDDPPKPDRSVMPEANVVGVEVGSLVRLDPFEKPPGKIYVIDEFRVRVEPDETPVSCRQLIQPTGTKPLLRQGLDYFVANEIDEPLGNGKVNVLAITGCGTESFLTPLGLTGAGCGPGWTASTANLQGRVLELKTTAAGATATTIPIQVFQLSQALETYKGDGGTLDVTFGELGDGGASLPKSLSVGTVFEPGAQETLTVDQESTAIWGAMGFRVRATSSAGTFSTDQSLAEVQELSAPGALPTTYFRAASNYALLLLGDPTHKATTIDGGANPSYDPRQAVHLLAVPVLDPSKADAGADGGEDAGGDTR